MKYSQIREIDIANGEGIRASLFVSGCEFNCPSCFNKEFQDFNNGEEWTEEINIKFMELINKSYIVGATILGGEPMHPNNVNTVTNIISNIKVKYPTKTIWVYTGFKYEYLLKNCYESLINIDVLVDGLFIEDEKDIKLRFKGSHNQRIIDMKESLNKKEVILWNNQ